MSAFYDNNVTDVGRLLLGDVQMGASFVPTKIVIGKGSYIAPNVGLVTANHVLTDLEQHQPGKAPGSQIAL